MWGSFARIGRPVTLSFPDTVQAFDPPEWGISPTVKGGPGVHKGAGFQAPPPLPGGLHFAAVFFAIPSERIWIPFLDSTTERVSDSRAAAGLWNPSEFSAVHHSHRTWAFWCCSCASRIIASSTPAFLASTILSIRLPSQNSAFRIFPLTKLLTDSIS